jgi:hypothetical protein
VLRAVERRVAEWVKVGRRRGTHSFSAAGEPYLYASSSALIALNGMTISFRRCKTVRYVREIVFSTGI